MFGQLGFLLLVVTFCDARLYEGSFQLTNVSFNSGNNFYRHEYDTTITWINVNRPRLSLASEIETSIDQRLLRPKCFLCSNGSKGNEKDFIADIFKIMFMDSRRCNGIKRDQTIKIQKNISNRFTWDSEAESIEFRMNIFLFKDQMITEQTVRSVTCILKFTVRGNARPSRTIHGY